MLASSTVRLRAIWLASLCAAALLLGCAASTPPPAAPSSAPTAAAATPLVAPGEAKVGDRTRCPVSGDEFVVTADSPKAEYEGKTYYFCCPHCAATFQADPKAHAHPAK